MLLKNQDVRNTVIVVRSLTPRGLFVCDLLTRQAAPCTIEDELPLDGRIWDFLNDEVFIIASLDLDKDFFCFYDLGMDNIFQDIDFYYDCLVIAANARDEQPINQQLN